MVNIKRPYNTKKTKAIIVKLKNEEAKKDGNYRIEEVVSLIEEVFHNKCYLCGYDLATGLNIEHFISHVGDKSKKFGWSNLFWSCSHCNGIKSSICDPQGKRKRKRILNCTNSKHLVESWIKYTVASSTTHVGISIEIDTVVKEGVFRKKMIDNTVELLDKIYNSQTPIRKREANNLRVHLVNELENFKGVLTKYLIKKSEGKEEECIQLLEEIEVALSRETPFTAFKKWIIRDKPFFFKELKTNLNPKDFKNIFE